MPSIAPADAAPRRGRSALRVVSLLVSTAIAGLALWSWLVAVPGALGNAGLSYMERVLSQVLMTFLLLLIGAGGVLVALGGFRALERRLARRSDHESDSDARTSAPGEAP